jgi:hypothetical protein
MTVTAVPHASDGDASALRPARSSALDRWLGHPAAFVVTALVLFVIFGQTFIANPDRVAPGDDPAFYTWRAEALLSEKPSELLDIKGPRDVLAGGYRVTSIVTGGILRRAAGIHPFTYTILLTVSLRCLTALLLAGFAYRARRDPLIFHSVAFAAASLFLTPPFYGYLDNLLCLFFLAAALFLLSPSAHSWPARIGLGSLLVASGLTHPTTLVIFFLVICAMAVVRLLFRRLDWRSVVHDDGPVVGVALASLVVTYLIWKLGIWGRSVPLSEAALPPPASKDFFMARLELWLETMRLPLNGPLFAVGAIGLLVAGKRAAEDELARVSIVWLAPLAGIFGFLAGIAYPYYRFFNTTLAWVMLVGLGGYFVIRFLLVRNLLLGALGALAVAAAIVTNFAANLDLWNKPGGAWLVGDERQDLAALQRALEESGEDRPVVFVTDTEKPLDTQVYGGTKFAANISRSGLPHGYLDRGHVYLGSVDNFLAGEPTDGTGDFYRELSEDTLQETQAGIEEADKPPIVVVARVFNEGGSNTQILDEPFSEGAGVFDFLNLTPEVWFVEGGQVTDGSTGEEIPAADEAGEPGLLHFNLVVLVLAVLLVPGYFLVRWMLPDAGLAEGLGLVPALAVTALALVGTAVVAVARAPLSTGVAWTAVAIAIAGSGLLLLKSRRRPAMS